MNDENVFGENRPTSPRYRTPPRGIILNSEETIMCVLLKHYGLGQCVPIFLQQEVDIDLFMTLTNEDLIEIGIKNEADRKAILEVINRS
ncbi:ankyrin repeat and SAM domain-containing protein 6-like [Bombus pascuorum]|uniref:ankyrin repeat and SAM domain-containing protein 6-like n=1 Tax=Bombus pascuorum TaxID=65598 RepID=UPI00298E37D8|nr:ankyrin repeat and SAM domain-containing protein 6-like [Bombus pascuorum]